MRTVCLDASFLIALYNERDQFHDTAERHFSLYLDGTRNQLLAPWPVLYETVSTKLVRNRPRLELLRRDWLRFQLERRLILLDDRPHREAALEACFAQIETSPARYRSLSLADRVIRALLADTELRIDYFITFNEADFVDVCRQYRRIMVASHQAST